jgi:hypothetical protein
MASSSINEERENLLPPLINYNLSYELRQRIQQVSINIRYMERTLKKSRHDEDVRI